MKFKNRNKIIAWSAVFVLFFSATMFWTISQSKMKDSNNPNSQDSLKVLSLDYIKEFDGTDDQKPIYIGMNGLVYDASAGREFYKTDGPYHYLAGKDSSTELNLVGGSIIKRKYPVIGRLQ
jgi:predicted heme/steroid binding protein